jgi:hypothetical protein
MLKKKEVKPWTLEIQEVFDEYDGPKLFSALNHKNQKMLVYWCENDKNTDGWLCCNATHKQLDNLKSSLVTARDIFVCSNKNIFYLHTTPSSFGKNTIKYKRTQYIMFLNIEEVPERLLPPRNVFLGRKAIGY